MKTFEDFLQEKHAEQYIGLDDDMPDDCGEWIANLDVDEVIDYADEAISQDRKRIEEEVRLLKKRKFPIGERPWCVVCFNRVMKELIKILKGEGGPNK